MKTRFRCTTHIVLGCLLLFVGVSSSTSADARTTRTSSRPTRSAPVVNTSGEDPNLSRARKLAASGQYLEASKLLYTLSRDPRYAKDSAQIKYILGLMLFEMKLNQSAAFVFFDLVKQESASNSKSRFLRQGLSKLAVAADSLDSDVLMRYAVSQVREDDFPAANRDMLYYRTGEVKLQEKSYLDAAKQFERVHSTSQFYNRSRYKLALSLAELGMLDKAQSVFEDLIDRTKSLGVTDRQYVSALLGRARVLYQAQKFTDAIEAYRLIPRDTEQWHEALFESTWAMLRDGRFRSALSNFHTLHSPYYENFYQPESLLLRAIVYLYICRYSEMQTTLNLFENVYGPVSRSVDSYLANVSNPVEYYRELAKANDNYDAYRSGRTSKRALQIPFIVSREILKEGDIRQSLNYLSNLDGERHRIDALPPMWRASGVGIYSKKAVEKRIEATRILIGKQVRRHLVIMQGDLKDLFEQNGFLRFEMVSGKKEALRKELTGKEPVATKIDESTERDYYIQNGYQYWPFNGEYWLDEIGNYHYVGVQACEQ